MHRTLLLELGDPLGVLLAPDTAWLARAEADLVAVVVDSLANAVDPAEAQGLIHGFVPVDARPAGVLLVEADEELKLAVVVRFQPPSEIGGSLEELGSHGFCTSSSTPTRR
jgi:hypothetical protein